MDIEDLTRFDRNSLFETDLVIVGGGPAGLTIAREFFDSSVRVLVLESGLLDETPDHAALTEVESIGEPNGVQKRERRTRFHGASAPFWSQELQPYGVRCRALGGSTHAWAGKSAAFDAIDFAARPWVPHSGWPVAQAALASYIDRAAFVLNLGPNAYDETIWKLVGMRPPEPHLHAEGLRDFFWQFARSRIDQLDIMRFGREFTTFQAKNVRVLLNATVTNIELAADGSSFQGLDIATIDGIASKVRAKCAVVAASAIENPRLLLASNKVQAAGIGNSRDQVGRYLMDHASARIGRFEPGDLGPVIKRFGFYGVRHDGQTHMYMHGLALSPELQERERLLNSAVYFLPERSPDDPWDALKRLLRRKSAHPAQDMLAVMAGAGLLTKGVGMRMLASSAMPAPLKDFIVNTAIRYSPNLVAGEFQDRGLPHKLTGLWVDAITEQRPDPASRITLSERTDRLGVPLACVNWRIGDDERQTIVRIADMVSDAFGRAGLPKPILEGWVAQKRLTDAMIIDMAHTLGTTRMSQTPNSGVVDVNCRVHGVRGLYVAGGSVFPTSGHANPTLMILALAIRLADTLKAEFAQLDVAA
ncbi:GMC oxidoreductase [Bradyrhizobium sp.]|uniref:GMC oxidoreductase n=1 Tax=Bradyrhizobium sp. TaxID=376 RepID=UPI002CBDCC70|nr:GMC oxidoreductase [Bradyrhizobium sp.]HWX58083.1 GMC oxidoreductase [Bradyrhizobium sp.]